MIVGYALKRVHRFDNRNALMQSLFLLKFLTLLKVIFSKKIVLFFIFTGFIKLVQDLIAFTLTGLEEKKEG